MPGIAVEGHGGPTGQGGPMVEAWECQRREILVFEVGGRRYGLPATDVRELLRAVAILPLPQAPADI
jgi:chemotaxis signal transduction protein